MKKRTFIFKLDNIKNWHDIGVFFSKFIVNEVYPEKKDFQIEYKNIRKTTSRATQSYYWGVIIKLVREKFKSTGIIIDDKTIHDILRRKAGHYKTIHYKNKKGEDVHDKILISFNLDSDSEETWDAIKRIQILAIDEFDVFIPDPNPHYKTFK